MPAVFNAHMNAGANNRGPDNNGDNANADEHSPHYDHLMMDKVEKLVRDSCRKAVFKSVLSVISIVVFLVPPIMLFRAWSGSSLTSGSLNGFESVTQPLSFLPATTLPTPTVSPTTTSSPLEDPELQNAILCNSPCQIQSIIRLGLHGPFEQRPKVDSLRFFEVECKAWRMKECYDVPSYDRTGGVSKHGSPWLGAIRLGYGYWTEIKWMALLPESNFMDLGLSARDRISDIFRFTPEGQ